MSVLRRITVVLAGVVLAGSSLFSLSCTGGASQKKTPAAKQLPDRKTEPVRYGKGYRFDHNGWVYLHIEGQPYERGYQHGRLAAPEIKEILRTTKYCIYFDTGMKWGFWTASAEKLFAPHMDKEQLDEIKGIAAGVSSTGAKVTWQDILAWNGYCELTDYWWPTAMENVYAKGDRVKGEHCSAFIATGSMTKDGKVVMAHNSWDNFQNGQFFNAILDIKPAKGHRMVMQSAPGFITSFTDYVVTDAGLMITETTIGGFDRYQTGTSPEFARMRKAIQYSGSMDEYVATMKKDNSGGYANSWLLADSRTNEIMRFELGLKFDLVQKKKDGYFVGFNAPTDPRIRNLECSNTGYADIRRHQGARQVRLTQLMEQYKGKLDTEIGKKILADHYDVYLKKDNNPCSRTVDGHYELDAREYMSQPGRPLPFQPRGTYDGKVTDSTMAARMSFWARWGNSSGMPFDAQAFLKEHIQWRYLDGYLKDRPAQPWTEFSAGAK